MAIDVRLPQEPEAPCSILGEDGRLNGSDHGIPVADLVTLYKAMLAARRFDERMRGLQRQGRLAFYLAGSGEEAVAAAQAHAMSKQDWLFPGFRDIASLIVRGISLQTLAHQAFGNAQSPTLGRPLPVFRIHKERNIASTGSGGATHLPHAVGVGWAARLRQEDAVAVASFAEGAVASGEFHAALNFAGVFKAPVVFVCHAHDGVVVAPRSKGYCLAGVRVDGHDLVALASTIKGAVDHARAGGGATLVEAVMPAFSASQDPIARLRKHLDQLGIWDGARQDKVEAVLRNEIDEAIARAVAAPLPGTETLFTDILEAACPPRSLSPGPKAKTALGDQP